MKKRKRKKLDWLRFRIFLVMGFFFIFFGVIFARAIKIQVVDSSALTKKVKNQTIRTIKIAARRGAIYDRNLNELAISLEVDSIYAHPGKVKGAASTARVLAPIMGMSRREIETKLTSDKSFVWLKRQIDISSEERGVIKALSGIETNKKSRRYYPNHQLAANLLGFEGIDSKGLEGVEYSFDSYLKGKGKRVLGARDARGRVLLFEDVEKRASTRGMDVVLTIDKVIQHIAERALKNAVDGAGAKGGMALVMDPETGEMLAMANLPTFDPNRFHRYASNEWRNRALTDSFEPGSVMKAFLLAAALDEGVVESNDIFFCENGSYKVADRVFHDTKEHAWLSLAQIIKYSSNIGAAKVGETIGKKAYYRHLKRFGFAEKTGIKLPGEGRGALRHYKSWSGVTLQTVSFGQGISVTALQLASAMSAIANGGYMMEPRIIKRIMDPDGEKNFESAPLIVEQVISETAAEEATRVLTGATGPKSSGVRAAVDGFDVAGKTGTAQKPDLVNGGYKSGAYMASFLGFVPASDAKLVIFVAIDEPQGSYYGGELAAPVFSEIAAQSLSYLGVFPEGGELESGEGRAPSLMEAKHYLGDYPEPRLMDIKKGVVPDLKGKTMRAVVKVTNRLGAEVSINGSGVVVRQSPKPGEKFAASEPINVWFK
ncbi:MAG: penicillin-binding protein [Thermodesulfobacteriota bacterium]